MIRLFLFILFLFSFISTNAQKRFYVAVAGNDHNPGTINKPYQTLDYALKAAQRCRTGSVTIELRAGTYYLDTTIIIHGSGFLPASLTIKNFEQERVVISAGRQLSVHWKPYQHGIFVAKVPKGLSFEQLYINRVPQILARYPNYDSSAHIMHGTAADALDPQRIKNFKTLKGGYVHALQAYSWGSLDYRISNADTSGALQLEGGWQMNRTGGMHKQYRFLENVFEELDAPHEWYLDRDNGLLYFYPPDNLDLSTALVEVSHLKNSIELKGTAQIPLKSIHIEGIEFTQNARTFMDTKEPLLRSDWHIYRGGVIGMDGTENCMINNCVFDHIGGNAIMLSNYNKNDTIYGCHIFDIGANAVCFIGSPGSVRSPLFHYADHIDYDGLDKTPGPLTKDFPQQCVASNNLIHDIGQIEKQTAGIEIDIAAEVRVSHNTIYNVPRAGINIGDGCFGGHIIEGNDVFNTVLETGDHGAFNSWGRDRYWSADRSYMDSLLAVHPELVLLDVQRPIIIRNNRFRCDHGWDIDLDDGSSNYRIYDNVCLSGGIKFREGFYRVGENNIVINNSFHPHVWFKNSGDIFEHNIVMKPYQPIQIRWWGKSVDYNLFADSTGLWKAKQAGTDAHSMEGDPLFTNPAKGDYTVAANSPALKIGFKNFPMDRFGVQAPNLKAIAMRCPIPELYNQVNTSKDHELIRKFKGAILMPVTTLDERSAYGLPDETGIIIMALDKESVWMLSGLKAGDVIRKVNAVKIKNVEQFRHVLSEQHESPVKIELIRNQQLMHVYLKTL